jgi:hypothetical protein
LGLVPKESPCISLKCYGKILTKKNVLSNIQYKIMRVALKSETS